jgi:hypothetical protein
MNEVEVEVRSNRKFGTIVKPPLEKALKTKALRLLGSADLEALSASSTSPVYLPDIREIGRDYALLVGPGEAFSHAAGLLLSSPVVSNDLNAIRTLEANGKTLPPTILRSHDLFGFLRAEAQVDTHTAGRLLKILKSNREWVPRCFEHASFEDGSRHFNCRLASSLSVAASSSHWSEKFYLKRLVEE